MINIKLHGILAKDFGEEINLEVGSLMNLLDAIDANRSGFIAKLNKLSSIGFNYCVIVNGKVLKSKSQLKTKEPIEQIDFVPIISGSGWLAAIGVGALIAGTALEITALVIIGGIFLSTGLAMLLAPKPEYPDAPKNEVATKGLARAFAFANRNNIASQGVAVPVGYGRLKVGSQVIQGCIKSFPQNVQAATAMVRNPYDLASNFSVSDNGILPATQEE